MPTLVDAARDHFGCATMDGVEVDNQHGGCAYVEARVALFGRAPSRPSVTCVCTRGDPAAPSRRTGRNAFSRMK